MDRDKDGRETWPGTTVQASAVRVAPGRRPGSPTVVQGRPLRDFIFTVEGQQTVEDRLVAQRMISFKAKDVPFDIVYANRPASYGPAPVRFFNWPTTRAQDGRVAAAGRDHPRLSVRSKAGLNFFTAQPAKYIRSRKRSS